jgi:N-glycosidase YbiA
VLKGRTEPPETPLRVSLGAPGAVLKTGASVEHWYQACKAQSRREFDNILACGTAAGAKRAGSQLGLRPDWEHVKFEVMLCALRGKFTLEPYRSALLLTNPKPLAENSPTNFVWGCRDLQGGYAGQNLLGLALMHVRGELVDEVRTRVRTLVQAR